MNEQQVFARLCYYDRRNPNASNDTERTWGERCFCDNCFYGRNELALEIIRLRELVNQVTQK